jgi:protein-tyrosine-phosphatase/predicted ATP-grasp superfamily ATP-dependent carboligase
VVLLFADALSAPEVAWSLVDAGHRVLALARRGTAPALGASRLVRVAHIEDPAVSLRRALRELQEVLVAQGPAVLMPLDDAALLLSRRLDPPAQVRICGPTGFQADVALDKRLQLRAAAQAGFDVAPTLALEHPADLRRVDFFPCVVKPALAARAAGDALGRGRLHALRGAGDALHLEARGAWAEPLLAQRFLAGVGEGLFGLAVPEGVVAWSAHRRVRMMNPQGSGSSACVSIPPDPALCAQAERFLRSLQWRGLFMIELLRDADGRAWFMELNGRPWGSMALARRMGFEYPAWALRLLDEPGYRPEPPAARTARMCRHVGRELVHLLFVLRGPRGPSLAPWPGAWATLRALLDVSPGQALYNWRRDDAGVLLRDTWETVRAPLRGRHRPVRALARWAGWPARRIARWVERRHQRRLRASGDVARRAAQAQRVLFLCYGNINRSAVAERHLKSLVGDRLAVSSCGFFDDDGRPADPAMVSVAAAHGVSLSDWASRRIDAERVDGADIIFAMEAEHLVRLHAEYPAARGKSFLLGCIAPPEADAFEIGDPHGRARRAYEACFRDVTCATSRLARLFTAGLRSPSTV